MLGGGPPKKVPKGLGRTEKIPEYNAGKVNPNITNTRKLGRWSNKKIIFTIEIWKKREKK